MSKKSRNASLLKAHGLSQQLKSCSREQKALRWEQHQIQEEIKTKKLEEGDNNEGLADSIKTFIQVQTQVNEDFRRREAERDKRDAERDKRDAELAKKLDLVVNRVVVLETEMAKMKKMFLGMCRFIGATPDLKQFTTKAVKVGAEVYNKVMKTDLPTEYDWRDLQGVSNYMKLPPKLVLTHNCLEQRAYHRDVWIKCYPRLAELIPDINMIDDFLQTGCDVSDLLPKEFLQDVV